MSRPARSAREVAIRVLERVTERGAYASAALDAELTRAGLDVRDSALATEIVYGALRVMPELDQRIQARLRSSAKLDPLVRAALRAGSYQLLHLARVPPHAVVDETVSLVRDARGARLCGFVNAVLRRLAEQRGERPEPPLRMQVPSWVREALAGGLSPQRLEAMLDLRRLPPPIGLRVCGDRPRQPLAEAIATARPGCEVQPGAVSPRALLVRRAGDPRRLPGYEQGQFAVQEEGSQVLALALGARPGDCIADLCAGHGGKTAVLAEQLAGAGRLLAIDLDDRKLERIPRELTRLQLAPPALELRAADLTVGLGGPAPADCDRVLLDAPCTGLGTLHRRPELLLRLSPADIPRMAQLQRRILDRAARLVRVGGLLAYSVCSPTWEEGAGVAEAFERENPQFERVTAAPQDTCLEVDPDGVLRIGPWLSGRDLGSPDLYQLVRFRRVR